MNRFICVSVALLFGLFAAVLHGGECREIPFEEGKTPPDATPGFVWCLVTKPAVIKSVSEKVKVNDATFYMEQVPAKYDWKEEVVEIAPAYKRAVVSEMSLVREKDLVKVADDFDYEFVPAKYEEVEQEVVVIPESERLTVKEPVFEDKVITYLAEPDRLATKAVICKDNVVFGNEVKGTCYTQVANPAQNASYVQRTLVADGTVVKEIVPAVTKKIKVRRLVEEAKIIKTPRPTTVSITRSVVAPQKVTYVEVPAQTKVIRKMVEVEPAGTRRVDVAEEYKVVTREVLEAPTTLVWREINLKDCGKEEQRVRDITKKYGSFPGTATNY